MKTLDHFLNRSKYLRENPNPTCLTCRGTGVYKDDYPLGYDEVECNCSTIRNKEWLEKSAYIKDDIIQIMVETIQMTEKKLADYFERGRKTTTIDLHVIMEMQRETLDQIEELANEVMKCLKL